MTCSLGALAELVVEHAVLLAPHLVLDDGVDAPGLGLGDALPGQGVPRPRGHPGLHLLQLLAPQIHLLGGHESDVDPGRGRPRHRCGQAADAAVSAADRSWSLIGRARGPPGSHGSLRQSPQFPAILGERELDALDAWKFLPSLMTSALLYLPYPSKLAS